MENIDYLKEEKHEEENFELDHLLSLCKFSSFEKKVLNLRRENYSIKEISEKLNCTVKQVYDANDRIKRKMKGAKNSLDNNW